MVHQIVDVLQGLGPVEALERAPDALRTYATERLKARTSAGGRDLDALLADLGSRFETSATPDGALWDALDAVGVDAWAYVLEAVVDAYVLNERRLPTTPGAPAFDHAGAGRPLGARGVLASASWCLLEIPRPDRMALLARLCRDFLDEDVPPTKIADQVRKAEDARSAARTSKD